MKKDKKIGVYVYNTGGVEYKRLIMKIGKSIDIDNRIQTFDSSNPKGRLLCFFPLPQPVIDSGCSARINSTLTKYEAFIHLSLSSHNFYQPGSKELFQFFEDENPIEIIGNLFEGYGVEPQLVPAFHRPQQQSRFRTRRSRPQKREIIDLLEKPNFEKVKEFYNNLDSKINFEESDKRKK